MTEEDEVEDVLLAATMLDTVLLVARIQCGKRWDVIDLLSRPNRCHEGVRPCVMAFECLRSES